MDARGLLRCINEGRKLDRGDVAAEGDPSCAPGEMGVVGLDRPGEAPPPKVGGGGREIWKDVPEPEVLGRWERALATGLMMQG